MLSVVSQSLSDSGHAATLKSGQDGSLLPSLPGVKVLLALIILVGVLGRLYQVDAPLLETHSGRQYDTAAIARNFVTEGSMNILYPQVDWRGLR